MALDHAQFMTGLRRRNPGENEFHQAVEEVAHSIIPFIKENPKYQEGQILERMTEPDRIISFRVYWATFPDPDTAQVFPFSVSPVCCIMFSVK